MDYLYVAIKNLTNQEAQALRRKISSQPLKLNLLETLLAKGDLSMSDLMEALSYDGNVGSLYTMKNRLLDDIIDIRLQLRKNPLIIVREKIYNLRNLLYSKDQVSLHRELKKYEKYAEEYELYNELKEIYQCYLMSYYQEPKRAEQYQELITACYQKQRWRDELEQVFYMKLLEAQDLFYFFNPSIYEEAVKDLAQAKAIHQKLNSKASLFFFLSAELSIELCRKELSHSFQWYEEKLEELFNLYQHSYLKYQYPNCEVAIKTLSVKLYYFIGSTFKTQASLDYIDLNLFTVIGYQMFDSNIYFYYYIQVIRWAEQRSYSAIPDFLDKHIREDDLVLKGDKMRNYYLYLSAVGAYYRKDFKRCQRILFDTRSEFGAIKESSSWVIVHNVLLSILLNLASGDLEFVHSEIAFLKRQLRKFQLDEVFPLNFKSLNKEIKKYEQSENPDGLIQWFMNLHDLGAFKEIMPEIPFKTIS